MKRNFGFDMDMKEPDFFTPCPTFPGIPNDSALKDAIDHFIDGSTEPDTDSYMKTNPVYHFDGEKIIESNKKILRIKKDMLNILRIQDERKIFENRKEIRRKLGNIFHILQDFYSHTNWVEMGKDVISINIGTSKNVNIKIAPKNMPTCSDCTYVDMKKNESDLLAEIWDTWNNSVIPDGIVKFERVFVCRNNVIKDYLTSGYYGGEEEYAPKTKAVAKCSHGGYMDSTVFQPPRGGISKDTDSMFFDPHYYLHHKAVNLSVQASIAFLENFRILLKDEHKFGLLLGINITSTNIMHLDTATNLIFNQEMSKMAMRNPKFLIYENIRPKFVTNHGPKAMSTTLFLILLLVNSYLVQ